MRTKKDQIVLVFNAAEGRTTHDNQPKIELTVYPCRVEDGRVRNVNSWSGRPVTTKLYLADLVIRASGYTFNGRREAPDRYDTLQYHQITVSTVDQAKAMAYTLATIEKRLRKLYEQHGETQTFGIYIARFAAAIGATHVLFPTRTGGWSHNDAGYEWLTPGEAVTRIDDRIKAWAEPSPTVTLYTTAPKEYDGFGTTGEELDEMLHGKTVRRVTVQREHLEWQTARYRSGAYYLATTEEHRGGVAA